VIAEVVVGRTVSIRVEVVVSVVPLLNIITWTSSAAVGIATVTIETGRVKTSSVAKTSTSQPGVHREVGSVGLELLKTTTVVTVLVTVVIEPDSLVVKVVVVVSSVDIT